MHYSLKGGLRLEYGLEEADYCRQNELNIEQDDYTDQKNQSPRVVEIVLPYIAISMITPEFNNYINIMIYDNNPELLFKFLEHALIHYPNLGYFEFEFTEDPY